MSTLERLEAWCANAVERTFAVIFPSALEPAQIARKLAAMIDRTPDTGAAAHYYGVRIAPADFARFAAERALLERQWTKMASALRRRAMPGSNDEIRVGLIADERLARGAIRIDAGNEPIANQRPSALRVEHGPGPRSRFAFASHAFGSVLMVGRDAECEIVVHDPRVSRRHARLVPGEGAIALEDLGSTNGTWVNGARLDRANLVAGDRLTVGDTTMLVEGDAR